MVLNNKISSIKQFDQIAVEYDDWFSKNPEIFLAEIKALKQSASFTGEGLEIGVGTGRFAEALGIENGIDPAPNMLAIAKKRGINVFEGTANELPFSDSSFDYTAFITVLCFIEDKRKALKEAIRVTKLGGWVIVGMIDGESELGQNYKNDKKDDSIYRFAKLISVEDMIYLLKSEGLTNIKVHQTLLENPPEGFNQYSILEGFLIGGFVAIAAQVSSKTS